MADQQKIHPVQDVEAPNTPTAPLVSRDQTKSDKGEPAPVGAEERYPSFKRTIPVMHSKPPKKRSCFCRCLCWSLCFLLLLIVAIGITGGIMYLVFRPKLPKYSVDKLQITQFNLSDNENLFATFNVTITARNPNSKIGIYYEGGSHIGVWYTETKLCEGALPKFYQGHENTTILTLPLSGQTQNASGLFNSLQQQQQETGNIPLNLKVKQPVRVKIGKLKLMKVRFYVRCRLVVDSLAADNDIRIQSSSCNFRLRL